MSLPDREDTSHVVPGDPAAPRVTVAIVTYRSKQELPECIESVLASDIPVRIVIIDNDSQDGTLELAQHYAALHSNVIAFSSGGNIGLAAANNLVMPHAQGEFVLMLNPDTVVRRNTISLMVSILDSNPRAGVVGPTNVYGDGRRFVSYLRSWNLWHIFLWRVLPYSLTRAMYDKWSRYNESEVFFVSGSCLLIRTRLFRDIGGYDPVFFLTIEDVCDLCLRVKESGYSVIFTPRTEVVHFCGRSGDQVPALAMLSGCKGSIYYFRKHSGRIGASAAFLLVTFACAGKMLVCLLQRVCLRREGDRRKLAAYLEILPKLIRDGSTIIMSRRYDCVN